MTKAQAEKFKVAFNGRGREAFLQELVVGHSNGWALKVSGHLGLITEVEQGNKTLEAIGGERVV